MKSNPEFVVYVGPMFSGKTSKMLMRLDQYRHAHKRIEVFKPVIDSRYQANQVTSHCGLKTGASPIEIGKDISSHLALLDELPHVVAVDEAFMIDDIAAELLWLFRHGVTITVSTLDLSATGQAFKEVSKMMSWASSIRKCAAVCTVCGRDAHYTYKKQVNDHEIEVGGSELYEPRCFEHHPIVNQRT